MIQSPQTIKVSRNGAVREATVEWRRTPDYRWSVSIESSEFDPVEVQAADAFEALCIIREQLEPHGWRVGVAGARADVWPSGMARDQGGGLRAYRLTSNGVEGLVDTFEPVDPASVTTVVEQRAETERLHEEIRRAARDRRA